MNTITLHFMVSVMCAVQESEASWFWEKSGHSVPKFIEDSIIPGAKSIASKFKWCRTYTIAGYHGISDRGRASCDQHCEYKYEANRKKVYKWHQWMTGFLGIKDYRLHLENKREKVRGTCKEFFNTKEYLCWKCTYPKDHLIFHNNETHDPRNLAKSFEYYRTRGQTRTSIKILAWLTRRYLEKNGRGFWDAMD